MDDQQTYLLNGLLSRQFTLGRIVRFRQVVRGRQAATYEILTAEQSEYLVQLYPPAFSVERLAFVARALQTLDANRFSVMPMLPAKNGSVVAEGPQGTHLMVSLSPAGSVLPSSQYTAHDISQVGLRLAWMHRLLREQVPAPVEKGGGGGLAQRLDAMLATPPAESARAIPVIAPHVRAMLFSILQIPIPAAIGSGWVHGHIQTHALLHDADHQLRTVVDWGLLHYGSPMEDLVDAFLALCVEVDGGYHRNRGRILRESYESLMPLENLPWTPVVGAWCAQRLLDASQGVRALPSGFVGILEDPERLATALAVFR